MAWSCWCRIGMTASHLASWTLNCGGGGGPLCPTIGPARFPVSGVSPIGTGCRCGYDYRKRSTISSFQRETCALGQISPWSHKEFKDRRLNEAVFSQRFSCSPLQTSGPAEEKANKESIATEELRLAEQKAAEEANKSEVKNVEIGKWENTNGALQKALRSDNGQWDLEASNFGGKCVVFYNYRSSYPNSYPVEVFLRGGVTFPHKAYTLDSANGPPDISQQHDKNNYQGFCEVLTKSISKDTYWHAIDKEMLGKEQAAQKKSLDLGQLRQCKSCLQDTVDRVNDRSFKQCICHVLAIASLVQVVGADTDPTCSEHENQMSISRREMKMECKVDEYDHEGGVNLRSNGSGDFSLQETVVHPWNGYWIGPDYEDGWGFIEAFVSAVGMDRLYV